MSDVRIFCPHGPPVLNQFLTEICSIVIALSRYKSNGRYYVFSSYHHPAPVGGEPDPSCIVRGPRPPDDYPVWQVGRAATAGTDYLERMKPAELSYRLYVRMEFDEALLPLTNYDLKASRIVSIGSGQSEGMGRFFTFTKSTFLGGQVTKLLRGIALEGMARKIPASRHFRLNLEDTVIGTLPLDTWKGKRGSKTLGLIREKTEAYLSSEDARALISDAARELVTIRQARSKWQPALDRWKRFCHGVAYRCPISQCKQKTQKFVERQELRRHLERVHRSDSHTMEALLDKGERFPLYDHATAPLS